MDKGSKIIFLALTTLLVISIILTLNRAFITRDYQLIEEGGEDSDNLAPTDDYSLVEP